MLIPGAVMFSIGTLVAIVAAGRNGVWKKGNYFGAGPGEQELVGRAVRMMDCKGTL